MLIDGVAIQQRSDAVAVEHRLFRLVLELNVLAVDLRLIRRLGADGHGVAKARYVVIARHKPLRDRARNLDQDTLVSDLGDVDLVQPRSAHRLEHLVKGFQRLVPALLVVAVPKVDLDEDVLLGVFLQHLGDVSAQVGVEAVFDGPHAQVVQVAE